MKGMHMRCFNSERYAVVASTLSLVVALSGASYAAVVVTGNQIKDGTVTTKDIKDKTIKTKDISATAQDALRGRAYSVRSDGLTHLNGGTKTLLTMSVPPGTYIASAKAFLNSVYGTGTTGTCGLRAAGRNDTAPSSTPGAMVYDQIVFTTDMVTAVDFSCSGVGTTYAEDAWLTAIAVGSVTDEQVPAVP